eukprot:2584541-Lingulodinium_polyedra.AAC.1
MAKEAICFQRSWRRTHAIAAPAATLTLNGAGAPVKSDHCGGVQAVGAQVARGSCGDRDFLASDQVSLWEKGPPKASAFLAPLASPFAVGLLRIDCP